MGARRLQSVADGNLLKNSSLIQYIRSIFEEHTTVLQVALFGTLLTMLWLVEVAISSEPIKAKWSHSRLNAAFIFLTLPVQLVMTTMAVAAATWVIAHHWGLLQLLSNSSSVWSKYILAFILLDFCDYIYHVTMHKLKWFWRFHIVHHSDQEIDVSTTIREHPGETFVRVCFLILWILLLGVGWEAILLRQTVETISNITSHSKYRLPVRLDRILGWVFITPNLHHVHHHRKMPYTNCNYGDVFSIWDRFFGTYAELQASETIFGIDSHPSKSVTNDFKEVLMMPFRKTRNRRRSSK